MEKPAPPQWTRGTNWRQGHVLPHAAAQHFDFLNAADPEATCVVVISHDCELANALKDQGQLISFVYFDLDRGQNVERKDGDPYELSIVVVFVPGDDPEAAADEADKVAESVEKAVRARLKDPKVIVLKACFPI